MQEIDAATKRAIVSELQSGHKLEAIKLYRQATGSDLRTAKNFIEKLQSALEGQDVEALAADNPSPRSPDQVHDEVLRLMQRGEKISAIKAYREHYKVDLKEAKEAVEAISKEAGIAKPAGCGATVLLITLGLATAIACT